MSITEAQLQLILAESLKTALAAVGNNQDDGAKPRVKAPERPQIDLGSSETQWAFFNDEWELYKRRASLKPENLTDELRACCSLELRKTLFDLLGSTLKSLDEKDLLEKIRSVAVVGKNKAVHRKEFYEIHQAPDEPVNRFVAKLRAKADRCNFTQTCCKTDCEQVNNYGDEMVKDQMVCGLYDKDIQQEVLAKDKQLSNFDETYSLIEAYELGKQAKSQLDDRSSSEINASRSQYKKNQSKQLKNLPSGGEQDPACPGCGTTMHNGEPRDKKCPAWGKKCGGCGKRNHFLRVCLQGQSSTDVKPKDDQPSYGAAAAWEEFNQENTSWFLAFGIEIERLINNDDERTLPHVEWDGEKFVKSRPAPLPSIRVHITPLLEFHEQFLKVRLQTDFTQATAVAFTDTCAQTCIAGLALLRKMNVERQSLIPTKHCIMGVTKSRLEILGILLAKVEYGGNTAYTAVYVCSGIDGLFLSTKIQSDLQILSEEYPGVSRSCALTKTSSADNECPGRCRKRAPPRERPNRIPSKDRKELEAWFLREFADSAFNNCVHQPIPKLSGEPLTIHFKDGAHPVANFVPIPMPFHWKKQLDEILHQNVCLEVMEKVKPGTKSTWCSKLVPVAKKDGTLRVTVDFQALNNATHREPHHTPSPFNLAVSIPPGTKKTILDAWNGYHSLALAEESRDATQFITEQGRYRYLVAPQGFHGSGDGYTHRTDIITEGFPRKRKCIDDSLLYDESTEDAFWHTVDYIIHCHKNGVIFNWKKFRFAMDEVDFAGFTITTDGIKPTKQMMGAIESFPQPKNITDLRSFFGLVNQVNYVFASSEMLQPFRELLKKNSEWCWDQELDTIFENTKRFIVQEISDGIKTFEVNRPCAPWTDWCKHGIGFSLFQKQCKCAPDPTCCKTGWRLIFANSRFTHENEKNYKPIEGESLALVFSLKRSKMFILGCPRVFVVTDHRPLVKIFGDKEMDKIENPRVFDLKEKTLMYNFEVIYREGPSNQAADALSRYPANHETTSTSYSQLLYHSIREHGTNDERALADDLDADIETLVATVLTSLAEGVRAVTIAEVKTATSKDNDLKILARYVVNGFPQKKADLPPSLQGYWNVKDELSVFDCMILYKRRIVIPKLLRREVVEILHSAHQAPTGMSARASTAVYWPGIHNDINNVRDKCRDCNNIAPSQSKEPMMASSPPDYPFEKVVSDYFSLIGFKYLLYADRYSGWISVVKIRPHEGNAKFLKSFLTRLFSVFGVPRELATDGGPPYNSHDYSLFLQRWGIKPRKSSAHYPQSNGRAELAVKTAKRILMNNCDTNGDVENDRMARALLQYRNTPLQGLNLSPAQILYGRNLNDCMPTLQDSMNVREEWRIAADDRERAMRKRHLKGIETYDEHSKELPELCEDDCVAVQNQDGNRPNRWDRTGKVVEKLPYRQYRVKMDGSNRVTLRNRRFLRKIDPVCSDERVPEIAFRQPQLPTSRLGADQAVDPNGAPRIPSQDPGSQFEQPHAVNSDPTLPAEPVVRRSTRERAPRRIFEAQTRGKSHSERVVES